jgi:hypothetical protein
METKPIYKSRTFQGLFVSALAFFGSQNIGRDLSQEEIELIGQSVGAIITHFDSIMYLIGLGLAGYGRMEAEQPITPIGGRLLKSDTAVEPQEGGDFRP